MNFLAASLSFENISTSIGITSISFCSFGISIISMYFLDAIIELRQNIPASTSPTRTSFTIIGSSPSRDTTFFITSSYIPFFFSILSAFFPIGTDFGSPNATFTPGLARSSKHVILAGFPFGTPITGIWYATNFSLPSVNPFSFARLNVCLPPGMNMSPSRLSSI